MAILISGTTNDITIDGVSVATDTDVSSAVAPLATTAYVDGKMVLSTAVTASGTAIDFTGIPSWVKRITVMFNGISTNGASSIIVQQGTLSGGIETTGYLSGSTTNGASSSATNGHIADIGGLAAYVRAGVLTLYSIGGNIWVSSGAVGRLDAATATTFGGNKTLSGTLNRIRITTVNGTDIFDAGSINIMYEG